MSYRISDKESTKYVKKSNTSVSHHCTANRAPQPSVVKIRSTYINQHEIRVLPPLRPALLCLQTERARPAHAIRDIEEVLVRHGERRTEKRLVFIEEVVDQVLFLLGVGV